MKNLFFVGACVIGLFGLGGCAKQVFLLGETNENQPELEERQNFFVSGLGQTETIDAARECEHAEIDCREEKIHKNSLQARPATTQDRPQ